MVAAPDVKTMRSTLTSVPPSCPLGGSACACRPSSNMYCLSSVAQPRPRPAARKAAAVNGRSRKYRARRRRRSTACTATPLQ